MKFRFKVTFADGTTETHEVEAAGSSRGAQNAAFETAFYRATSRRLLSGDKRDAVKNVAVSKVELKGLEA